MAENGINNFNLKKRTTRIILILLIPLLLVWGLYLFRVGHLSKVPGGELEVTFFDVGQGDSVLISTPNKKKILIDGGPPESGVFPLLEKRGIHSLQTVVLSHPDIDHVGGLIEVVKRIPVEEVLDSGYDGPAQEYKEFLDIIKQKSIPYRVPLPGEQLNWDQDIVAHILGPLVYYHGTEADANNNSLVIRMVYRNVKFLFTGDIEEIAELDLLDYGREVLHCTILKAPHHGSSSSSTTPFLDWTSPEAVVISCGRGNPWGLPHPVVMERYRDYGFRVYRTDWDHTISILTDGHKWKVQ